MFAWGWGIRSAYNDAEIFNALRNGSKEEIGKALTVISRLKDPSCKETLKDITKSSDPFLSAMAAYALGESGDPAGMQFLEGIIKTFSHLLPSLQGIHDMKIVEEVLRMPGILDSAMGLYNRSYYAEAKEKLLQVLQLYSIDTPKMNVPHFDELVQNVVGKTKGLLMDSLGVCEFNLGNVEAAMQYSLEAVTIAEQVEDPQLLKIAYADLGHFHMAMGNIYSALELFNRSLEIDEASHDPWRKRNRTLSNLSQLYYHVGNYDKSLEYAHEALEQSEKEKDLNGAARCLNLLGVILSYINEIEEAKACLEKAMQISTDESNNQALQSLILNNLAYIYSLEGDTERAKETLLKALDLAIQMSDKYTEGTIRSGLAMIEMEDGDVDGALLQAQTALEIFRHIYSPTGQSDTLFLLGSIEHFINDNPFVAYDYYKEAIKLSETLRENLMLDDFKISFAGNQAALYQQMVSLCIGMNRTEEAFEYIERSKSRAFVDMLASMSNTIESKKLSPGQLEQIANLKGRMDLLRRQIAASYSGLNKDASDIRHEDIKTEMRSLEETYLRTFEDLKMKDPEWTSLVSVNVADIAALQSNLDDKTALIELYQTSNELFLIIIKKDTTPSAISIPMDVEDEVERLFTLFTALSSGSGIDTRSHEYIKDIKKPLTHFYDLLIQPIYNLIKDAEHLVIVPHIFWHYLPFHALQDSSSKEYLIDKFSISYAPSSTVLTLCNRAIEKSYSHAVILANPSGDLPYAEEEGRVIAERFDSANLFVGEQATLDKLSDRAGADVIHLACHGYFRGDEPLFSHVVLSDDEGNASPFFLPDIFNLKLNASLVTLSACETGLSQFTPGDELIGIARAFFYAGTSSLLTSMWTINDKSTSILMKKLYERIIGKGESKAKALQGAVQGLKAMPKYGHPYYWAAFFFTGSITD